MARKSSSSRRIPAGDSSTKLITAFAPFGDVIQNPLTHHGEPRGLNTRSANQGTATVVSDVSHMQSHYNLSPSRKPARIVMNMFVCQPRELLTQKNNNNNEKKAFHVKILERHPYTPQTFIPIGISPQDRDARYLVIVAPTLPAKARDKADGLTPAYPTPEPRRRKSLKERLLGARPNPFTNDFDPTTTPKPQKIAERRMPKGPGEPDPDRIQAFIFRGDQAVTYAPGTWHAPMVVLGRKPIEFVVVQYANGVQGEDVQEIAMDIEDDGDGLMIDIDHDDFQIAAPGYMRAKL